MIESNELLNKLQQLLSHKKSKSYYCEKLDISEGYLEELLKELKNQDKPKKEEKTDYRFSEDITKGTAEISLSVDTEIRTLDELIQKCKIDTSVWNISKYVQNYWGNAGSPRWQVKAWLDRKKEENLFQEKFLEFIENYSPSIKNISAPKNQYTKTNVSLILPKQDAHFNKYDINGDNDINDRFQKNDHSIWRMLKKASVVNNIEEVVYIVGSDQFNSEWTGLTTKGTNQSNIFDYQQSFDLICNHEVEIINSLLEFAEKVKIVFVPGNHDEYVGWHLIHWLEAVFKKETRLEFDSSILNTKYHKYGNSAIMLNHGDAIKPKELAQKFPIGFKKEWSNCDNYYIFTGDKHHELSLDIHSIKFYQVPQLSSAKSKWDDKQGYIDGKAEMTAFVITSKNGMSDIYKEIL